MKNIYLSLWCTTQATQWYNCKKCNENRFYSSMKCRLMNANDNPSTPITRKGDNAWRNAELPFWVLCKGNCLPTFAIKKEQQIHYIKYDYAEQHS